MPTIYLSPSVHGFSPYITGGNEEYYMNRIADAMVPYLRGSGIGFNRNNPDDTLSQIIAQSNAGNYDLHLALHSNVSPDTIRGVLQGPDVYYNTTNEQGRRAADMITENLKSIYPNPSLVTAIATTTHKELSGTKGPAVLVEIAYHDNYADATWLKENINEISKNLAQSVAQYLEVPFVSS